MRTIYCGFLIYVELKCITIAQRLEGGEWTYIYNNLISHMNSYYLKAGCDNFKMNIKNPRIPTML